MRCGRSCRRASSAALSAKKKRKRFSASAPAACDPRQLGTWAIALAEPERDAFLAAIDDADGVAIGAPTLVESGIVLTGRNASAAAATVNDLLAALDTVVLESGERHWREALLAWREFGRGRHPARLNFGDCLTYATAKVADEPLLAKGGDFTKTT